MLRKGIYNKFNVTRTDGQSSPGEKHALCDYFVLDLTHDPFAADACIAYAAACEATHPELAADLREKVVRMKLHELNRKAGSQ